MTKSDFREAFSQLSLLFSQVWTIGGTGLLAESAMFCLISCSEGLFCARTLGFRIDVFLLLVYGPDCSPFYLPISLRHDNSRAESQKATQPLVRQVVTQRAHMELLLSAVHLAYQTLVQSRHLALQDSYITPLGQQEQQPIPVPCRQESDA